MKGFELMANRSDRRGEHADSSLGHSMAVTTIGTPRANIHHGPEPEHSSIKRPEIRLQSTPNRKKSMLSCQRPKEEKMIR